MESFDFILPSPILVPFVKHYWALKTDMLHVGERITPVGCVQMVFHREDRMFSRTENEVQPLAFIGGQSSTYTDLQSTGKTDMLVILFQPHGAKTFFNVPIDKFNNRNIPVEDLHDKPLCNLAEQVQNTADNRTAIRLIEAVLISRLSDFNSYNHKRIARVLNSINYTHQPDMKILAETACLSYKQFGRIFAEYTGATPKEFTRIVRFQRAIHMLQNDPGKGQAELALDCGFYDQPHLIKEFKTFSGYTPNEYMALCMPYSDYFTEV